MARSHLCRTYPPLGRSRSVPELPRGGSAGFAHLHHMDTTSTSATTPSTLTNGGGTVVPAIPEILDSALSVQELAAQLHVSAQTIYDLRSQGRGPVGFRVGRHLRFRRSEIESWLSRLEGEDHGRHPDGGAR